MGGMSSSECCLADEGLRTQDQAKAVEVQSTRELPRLRVLAV